MEIFSKKTSYTEILNYLFQQLPMYQRIGASAYKADLDNTILLCKLLNNPEKSFKSIHVAGTNGKGSTSHMLAAIFQAHGWKVGLYTSPHYKDFRERIKVNGAFIPKKFVRDFVLNYQQEFEKIKPSFFEWTVGLAFHYFRKEKVDIAIIEVGLGGRLDSTNVIQPLISVITNISFDHTQFLGDTLEKIAAEKAGIIKPNTPVVVGEWQAETAHVFLETAAEKKAPILFASQNFSAKKFKQEGNLTQFQILDEKENLLFPSLKISLLGDYQPKNLITVLQTIAVLKEKYPDWELENEKMEFALQNIQDLTGMMGRWQILSQNPLIVCDSAHNEGGLKLAMEQLTSQPANQIHFVLGAVNDKDLTKMLALLPTTAQYYFCKPAIPRGLDPEKLKELGQNFGLQGKVYKTVKSALAAAKRKAGKDDIIYIGGSTFVVAEVI